MSVSNTTKRVKEIRRKTRRKFSSEEKICIVPEAEAGQAVDVESQPEPEPKPIPICGTY
jgi:hypothetical protein